MRHDHKLAAVAVAIALSAAAGKAEAADKTKIKIAESIRYIGFLPAYVAKEKGFFDKEGLDVDFVTTGSRTLCFQSMIAGEADFCGSDPAGAALARRKGADVKAILPIALRAQNYLMVAGDRPTTGPDLLKGMTVAMAAPPWTGSALFDELIKKEGFSKVDNTSWKPGDSSDPKDVLRARYVGFFTELPQVYAKNANAILVVPPYEAMAQRELGMKVGYSWGANGGPYLFTTLNVTEATIKAKPAMVQAVTNAFQKTFAWAAKNQPEVEAIAEKWFPSIHPDVVKAVVKRMYDENVMPNDVATPKDAYERNINGVLKEIGDTAAGVPFEEVVDTSFAAKAMGQ